MVRPMESGACWSLWLVTIVFAIAPVVAGWLHSLCDNNDDCTVANAECFSYLCECTPGYFYSEGSQSCVETCSQMSDTFDFDHMVIYIDTSLLSAAHLIVKNRYTPTSYIEKCLDPCAADSSCLSIWFRDVVRDSDCSLFRAVPRDTGTAFKQNVTRYNTYVLQKMCV